MPTTSGLMSTAPTPRVAALRMGLLASGYGLMLMVSVSLMPSVPAMARQFGSVALAQLILISPVFLKVIGGPAAAWLMRHYGRRRPLLISLLTLALAAALCIFVDAFWPQLLLRLCMGFAGAAIATISTTLVGDYFEEGAQRNRALSWTGIAPMLGAIVGLFGGGMLAQTFGWQWANALLLLALPLWLGVLLALPEPAQTHATQANANTAAAKLPTELLPFLGVAAFTAIISVLGGYQLPLLMAEHGIESAGFAGAVLAASSIVAAVAAGFYPALRVRFGFNGIFIWMMAVCAGVYAVLAFAADKWMIGLAATLLGLGGGLLYPFCTGYVIEHATPAARPRAVGLVMSGIFVGQLLCPFLAEAVRSNFSVHMTFFTAAGIALVAVVIAASVAFSHGRSPRRAHA